MRKEERKKDCVCVRVMRVGKEERANERERKRRGERERENERMRERVEGNERSQQSKKNYCPYTYESILLPFIPLILFPRNSLFSLTYFIPTYSTYLHILFIKT